MGFLRLVVIWIINLGIWENYYDLLWIRWLNFDNFSILMFLNIIKIIKYYGGKR